MNKAYNRLISWSMVLLLVCICGCSSVEEAMRINNAPLEKDGKTTSFYIESRNLLADIKSYNIKYDNGNEHVVFNTVIEQCNTFLKANAKENSPFALDNNTVANHKDNMLYSYVKKRGFKSGLVNEKALICLNPIVVVFTKEQIVDLPCSVLQINYKHKDFLGTIFIDNCKGLASYYYRDGVYMNHSDNIGTTVLNMASKEWSLGSTESVNLLPQNGYSIGTNIISQSNDLFWFSPDMNIKPQPLEIDKDGLGHIPTPWGELVLTPKEDSWSVTAESK